MAGNWTWQSNNRINNEAEFRAWAGGISDALRRVFGGGPGATYAANRVEASTIASNWGSTISGYNPAAGGTGAVTPEIAWEVWRLPDYGTMGTLYIRVGYCISGTSVGTPGLSIRVGTSYTAPASGNLVGVDGSGSVLVSPSSTLSSVAADNWASCDDSGFVIVMGINHPSGSGNRWWFAVDRHRNTSGAPLNTAVAVFRGNDAASGTGLYLYDLVEPNLLSFSMSGAPCVTHGNIVDTTVNLNANNEVQVYPWWTITKNSMGVSKMVCTHAVADIPMSPGTQQVRWLPSTGGSPTLRTVRTAGTFLLNTYGYDIHGTSGISSGTTVAFWWSDP